ncbi:4518_t:CDS:2, partial [Entrophospora sp. SA101]
STPTTPKSSKGTSSDNQIQIDDDSQLDIKKLSSKERRQIREYFTAVDLGEIGRRLDQAEHDAMTSPDQQQNSQQQPNTRFFSVQESV